MRFIIHSNKVACDAAESCFTNLLKAGYILADETASIGFVNLKIGYIKWLESQSLRKQAEVILLSFNPETEQDDINLLNMYIAISKAYHKLKHPANEFMKQFMLVEHATMVFFKEWIKEKEEEMHLKGFHSLMPLIDGVKLGYYYLVEEDIAPLNAKKYMLNYENLLKLDLPDTESKESMFLLTDVYFSEIVFKEERFVSPLIEEAFNLSNSYFYLVAGFPNVNNLTETELRTTRDVFTESLKSFRSTIDKWLRIVNTSKDKLAGLIFFKEEIIPQIPIACTVIESNDILKINTIAYHRSQHYLYIGEITKKALLNYYEIMGCISLDKRKEMEKKFESEGEMDRRIPMMFISHRLNQSIPYSRKEAEEPMVTETQLTSRKFIEID